MKNKLGGISILHFGILIFVVFSLLSAFAPLITSYDAGSTDLLNRLKPPSSEHIFGTDRYGRDVFTRVVFGGRISFFIGISVTVLSVSVGCVIGLYSSYFKQLDSVLMRITDAMMAIPPILFAIALMSSFGASVTNVILSLSLVYIPVTARIVRSNALQIKQELYIKAIRTQGAGYHRIIWRHIFPNIAYILLVQASIIFAETIISEASLSFLGAGIPAPAPSWGSIIQEGKSVLFKGWWMTIYPSAAILGSVLSLFFIGDGIRQRLSAKRVFYYPFWTKRNMLKKASGQLDERRQG